jgi:hypothetical protein
MDVDLAAVLQARREEVARRKAEYLGRQGRDSGRRSEDEKYGMSNVER